MGVIHFYQTFSFLTLTLNDLEQISKVTKLCLVDSYVNAIYTVML